MRPPRRRAPQPRSGDPSGENNCPVEFENKVSVSGRRVAGRVLGAGASGNALDDRDRVGTVEISDRIAVGAGFVDDAVRRRQEAVVRPAPHNVAEIDQRGPGDDRRGEPFARPQAERKPRHLGSCERGHKAVVGMRRLTERIVFKGILRRIVQKTQIGVGFVGEIRREVIGGQTERHGKGREHPVAHRVQCGVEGEPLSGITPRLAA